MNLSSHGSIVAVTQCPVCGANVRHPVFGRGLDAFDLVQCEQCDLVYAMGHRNSAALNESYDLRAHTGQIVRERKHRSIQLYQRLSGGCLTPPGPTARALDIGCNTGVLLDEIRSLGWKTEGIERAPGAAAIAAARHIVYDVDVENPSASLGSSYGLVTMTHVLEHLRQPVAALSFVARHLDDGGTAIIEVPNWQDPGRSLWRHRYRPLELGDHICFFDRNTLAATLRLAGLRVVRMWSGVQGATLVMPSVLSAIDVARTWIPHVRGPASGQAPQGRKPTQKPQRVGAAVLRGLDRLDPWLQRLTGRGAQWGANLVAVVSRPTNGTAKS